MSPFGYKVITDINLTEEGTIPIAVRSRTRKRRGITRHMRGIVPDTNIYIIGDTVMCHPILEREVAKIINAKGSI